MSSGLPPHREAFEGAEEGEYRLRATGEVVVNPDLFAKFRIRPAQGARGKDTSLGERV